MITMAQIPPLEIDNEINEQTYSKLPLSRVTALGTGLEPLVAAVQQITSGGQAVAVFTKSQFPPAHIWQNSRMEQIFLVQPYPTVITSLKAKPA